jgi:hypothetical protein
MLLDLDAVIADADEIPEAEMTCNKCASWNDGSPYKAGLLGWCNHRRREACYGNETCKEWYPRQDNGMSNESTTAKGKTKMKCRICKQAIDIEDGNGVTDASGRWAHEECQDAQDENDANESDFRD